MIALLVIDMQFGCFAGSPPRHDAEGTVARINQLARCVRPQGPVVFIQHTDPREGLAQGSAAWHLLDELDRGPEDAVVEKTACDAFLDTGLEPLLERHAVTDLIVTGCATDFCVDTTLPSACSRGFAVTVPDDAHTTRDRPHLDAQKIIEHHHYMWENLLLPGDRKVRVLPTSQLLQELASSQSRKHERTSTPSR